jgi:CRISPR-associated protein Cmr5
MQTRDQRYAVDAYQSIAKVKAEDRQNYGGMAHKLPILIRTAGLAQALSFVDSRGKDAQKLLLEDIAKTIGKPGKAALLSRAREAELGEYMLLTKQVMDALLWYKRFAQSVLGVQASDTIQETNNEFTS